ncbi:MAG: response regulator [Myxococcales bacterium]|nr:response regulator [Myxococcales bacterium]
MSERVILLVEDNPSDEELTLRALKKSNILNRVVVVRDGAEALDWLFRQNAYAERSQDEVAQVVLLDLKLPKIDGLGVLRAIRADPRTKLMPVVVLTSSIQEQDVVASYGFGANSYVRKPVDFTQFVDAVRQLGLYWLVINQPVPT